MSTYADMVTPMVDTAVTLIESAQRIAVGAIGAFRGPVTDRFPQRPVALAARLDVADAITVTFDAAERLLHAQRDAYLDVAQAAWPEPGHAGPAVKAA